MYREPAGRPLAPDVLGDFGPFFALDTHPVGDPPGAPWRRLDELVRDPGALHRRVGAVRAALAASHGVDPEHVEPRVAASTAHLGLAARLASPALALAVALRSRLPDSLDSLRWQAVLGRPVPLSVPDGSVRPADPSDDPAGLLARWLAEGPLAELDTAFAALSLSPRVLRGNTASAVHGAAAVVSTARVDLAGEVRATVAALRERPPLAGATTTVGGHLRRRSCCLVYRAAPDRRGPVCGDCVLRAVSPARRPQAR